MQEGNHMKYFRCSALLKFTYDAMVHVHVCTLYICSWSWNTSRMHKHTSNFQILMMIVSGVRVRSFSIDIGYPFCLNAYFRGHKVNNLWRANHFIFGCYRYEKWQQPLHKPYAIPLPNEHSACHINQLINDLE